MCRVERLLSGISRLARRAALSSLVKEDAKKHISQKLIIIINRTLFGASSGGGLATPLAVIQVRVIF